MVDVALIEPDDVRPDLFVGCVGYEHRSLQALKDLVASGYDGEAIVFDYRSGGLHSYLENIQSACLRDAQLIEDFGSLLERFCELLSSKQETSILLDVTSLDREKIAHCG